jgi:hypothetical protein
VYSGSIVDGQIGQSDLYPGFVKALYGVYNNTVTTQSIVKGAVTEDKLSADVQTKLNSGGGTQGPAGPAGKDGVNGKDGTDAIVSVTALTSLTNRPDSGANGDWAKDTLTRTVAITKQSAVPASNCGPTATTCWFYTGSLIDTGTFTTIDGAKSPGSKPAADINGSVQGSVTGGTRLEFYASSETPNPSLVQGTVDGGGYPTSTWAKQFFPANVVVTDAKLLDWSWTYTATTPNTCEKWVNALAGNSGDIKGVNVC